MQFMGQNSTGIKKVYHVYEAEAVTLYYLSNYITFNEKRTNKILKGSRDNILVFDFGGGSINVSIIGLTRPLNQSDKTRLEILARVGYAIGGETIDRAIAKIIWDKLGEVTEYLPNPFDEPGNVSKYNENEKEEWWLVSLNLKDISEQIKIKLSDKMRLNKDQYKRKYNEEINRKLSLNPRLVISYDNLSSSRQQVLSRVLEDNDIILELEEILNDHEINKVLLCLQDAVKSAINIYFENNYEHIHTVIFSGRSSFFPKVRENIKTEIEIKNKGKKPFYIESMTEDEVKSAVAYGTTYYAAEQENIVLSKSKTLANYGYLILNPEQHKADTFRNIIPINSIFNIKNNKAEGIDKNQSIKHNNRVIRFYQVNSEKEKSQRIINNREKVKYNQITEVELSSDIISHLKLQINSKDKFEGKIDDGKGIIPITANIEIKDILEDTDKGYSWLLL